MKTEPSESEINRWKQYAGERRRACWRVDFYGVLLKPVFATLRYALPERGAAQEFREAVREAKGVAFSIAAELDPFKHPAAITSFSSRACLPAWEVMDGDKVAAVVRLYWPTAPRCA